MVSEAGMSDEAVNAATGLGWNEWRAKLDANNAQQLTHPAIVKLVHAQGVSGWWGQMVTFGYQRLTGKRAMVPRCDGAYVANASRTVVGDKDEALARWLAVVEGIKEFDQAFAKDEPRVTRSENWRYWRVNLDNGSKVDVVISDKPGGKAVVAIGHEKLADANAVAKAKLSGSHYWRRCSSASF